MASGMIDRNALVAEFRSFLDVDSVLHDAEQLKPYECDGLTAYRQPCPTRRPPCTWRP